MICMCMLTEKMAFDILFVWKVPKPWLEERTINSKLGNFFKCIRDFIGKDVKEQNE